MTTATRPTLEELRRLHKPGERRTVSVPAEVRSTTGRTVRGHAAVFRSATDLGTFTEEVSPGAFKRALSRAGTDPLLLFDHDSGQVLARQSAGTLRLAEDERGLAFEAELVSTRLADDVLELVRSRHLTGCSFSFTIARDRWQERGGKPHRIIDEVRELFEVSVVAFPAYPDTDADVRELRARARAAATRGRLQVREVSPYQPAGPHSFFRDLCVIAEAERRSNVAIDMARPVTGLPETPFAQRSELGEQGGVREAQERLARFRESRNVTTADPGIAFGAGGVPAYIADHFTAAARARATVATALPQAPLPESGPVEVTRPQLTTGASVQVQTAEAGAVAEQDIDTNLQALKVATVAGMVDASVQAVDRSLPGLDLVLARELGAALAERVDVQVLSGTGTGGQTLGLIGAAGSTVTYTDASPTAGETVEQAWKLAATVATAYGAPVELTIAAPRRVAWIEGKAASATAPFAPRLPGTRTVEAPCMPANRGAGTNEDALLLLAGLDVGAVRVLTAPVTFQAMTDILSGSLEVRFICRTYLALDVAEAKAVGLLQGTGLATPAFA